MFAAGTHVYFSMEENKTCSVNYFCFGAVLIFIGSILLCALGFTVVLPFEATKDWYNTSCTVISAEINETVCSCDDKGTAYPGCAEQYPCLQIYVLYKITTGRRTNSNVIQIEEIGDLNSTSVQLEFIKSGRKLHSSTSDESNIGYGLDKNAFPKRLRRHRNHRRTQSKIISTETPVQTLVTDNKIDHHSALLYRSWTDIVYIHVSITNQYILVS